jgi:hypothetical protein
MKINAEIPNESKSLKARVKLLLRIYGLQITTPEWTMMDPLLVFNRCSIKRNSKAQVQNG